ncbi:MAG TPA: sorbosone dehydrogenase family protein [Cycloclasticus sp.]|jgi:glucose/arabinose dehydrogenase|nr:sorbosone dehydrogenase family protein [Cycloclasticus sp.]
MKAHLKSIMYMVIAGVLFWLFLPAKYTINMPFQFANSASEKELLERLEITEGFTLSVHADNLSGVRALVVTDTNDIITSRPNIGTLTLVYRDADNDGRSDGHKLLLKGLNKPHGIAIHKGWLYIAETDAVLRIKYDAEERRFIGTPHYIIRNSFPGGGNHWSRSLKIGPDNKLYISAGSSCNVCIESTATRASILQYDLDGKNEVVFASGLRNTVGFDWSPDTRQLFGVDNGRDFLGENRPPEELNLIQKGQHYGWPYEHGSNNPDPEFSSKKPSSITTTPPVHEFTAHSAPLSLLFIQHNKALLGSALIALHGSWNRSKKSGYKIVKLTFDANGSVTQHNFLTGFELDDNVIGRPVDLTEDIHGNIYLSDDYSGKIYKLTLTKITY